jgi:hypothetical protein
MDGGVLQICVMNGMFTTFGKFLHLFYEGMCITFS